jgi:hypothetical protein
VLGNSVLTMPAARGGAAFQGTARPWAPAVSGAGLSHVQIQIPGSAIVPSPRAAGIPGARPNPAIMPPLGVRAGLQGAGDRKQYVHMTRVNAGGDGASGPHPEREPGLR